MSKTYWFVNTNEMVIDWCLNGIIRLLKDGILMVERPGVGLDWKGFRLGHFWKQNKDVCAGRAGGATHHYLVRRTSVCRVCLVRRVGFSATHLLARHGWVRHTRLWCDALEVAEVVWCDAPDVGAAHQALFVLFCSFCVLVSSSKLREEPGLG